MLEEEAKKLVLSPKYLKQEAIEERNGTAPYPKFLANPARFAILYDREIILSASNLKMQELSH
jgi:hypothetical protein